jgi:hypothetical protein
MSNKYKRWQITEDNLIKEKYATTTYPEIARLLDRPVSTTQNRALKIGIKKGKKMCYWSKNDADYLIEKYHDTKAKDIAKILKRSTHCVLSKARYLGLSKKITLAQEKQILKLVNETTFNQHIIAKQLGISETKIRKFLQVNSIQKKWYTGWSHAKILEGFSYNGNQIGKDRAKLLYAYKNTCWDCKKTFLNIPDLIIHHDWNILPVKVIVLCKECHKKRHGVAHNGF